MKERASGIKLKEKAVKVLEFPEELVLPRVVFGGNQTVTVENYRAVIEYERESIRISTAGFLLRLQGKNFEIELISDDGLVIRGTVTKAEFIY